MRQGQQNRRGRGGRQHNNNNTGNNAGNQHRKGQNPLTRSFESNGPDVKIRGTPAHVAEKYISLARDALTSGDRVLAENYLQHAEHYNRIILTYREQHMGQQQPDPSSRFRVAGMADLEGGDDMGDDDGEYGMEQSAQPPRGMEPQPSSGGGQSRPDDRGERPQRHERQDRQRNDRQQRFEGHNRYEGQSRFEGRSDNRQDNRYESRGDGRLDNRNDNRSDNRNEHRSEGRPEQRTEQRTEPRQDNRSEGGRQENRGRYRERDRDQQQPRSEGGRAEPGRAESGRGDSSRVEAGRSEQPLPIQNDPVSAVEPVQRTEAPPRRRERFVEPQDDQPAFLRRPVRRTRRETTEEGTGAAEAVSEAGNGKPAV